MIDHSLIRLRVRPGANYVSSGRTVLATDDDGLLLPKLDRGLFVDETRLLSRWAYTIEGKPPDPVSASNVSQNSWLGYFIAPAPDMLIEKERDAISAAAQEAIELRISRFVGGGIHEDVDITNFARRPVKFAFEIELDADFADQSETNGERQQRGKQKWSWEDRGNAWELGTRYTAEHRFRHQGRSGTARIERGLIIRFSNATSPPTRKRKRIRFSIALEPHETWHCCVDFEPSIEDRPMPPIYGCRSFHGADTDPDRKTAAFLSAATRFSSAESGRLSTAVVGALEQGKNDLASLRLFDLDTKGGGWTVAAGLPLYVALFGRDTLTASWEAAMVSTDLMRGTLPVLAETQGREVNDWRDEQPGRMIHEAHGGPLAALNFTPQGRSYGSLTTSGFYPFVVAQLWHWTGDKALIEPYVEPAIKALQWLDDCSDRNRDGFYDYKTRSSMGTENQGWKDSGDALVHADGSEAKIPIATCEEQGIAYAAKFNLAEVLWWLDRKDEAKLLADEASELKKRFNETFWMEDEGFFAMAIDADGRQVQSIGSNALHCVATGIADKSLVTRTMERLFAKDMFSGWGVRTLSSDHPSYNPYSYHRGTVWPVEHGPFAVGAYRYGCHDEVERIAQAQFETAALFDHFRLPECIAGHQRDDDHPFPAVYPAANAPQAWSATTTYVLLQAMLGLQPYAPLHVLFIDPHLPDWLPEITVRDMRVAEADVSVRFFRKENGSSGYEILDQQGRLNVVRQPSPWSLTAGLGERAVDLVSSLFH